MTSKIRVIPGVVWLPKLLNSEKYSDLKLVCQGQEFKVHKAVVCSQSPVLAAACDSGFKEAHTNIINIEEFDVETVKNMVAFMYGEDYDDSAEQSEPKNGVDNKKAEGETGGAGSERLSVNDSALAELTLSSSGINVKVNAIADYYDIPNLKELATARIRKEFETSWSADHFSAVVNQIFNSTSDKTLQHWATKIIATHIEELIYHPVFRATEVIDNLSLDIMQQVIWSSKSRENAAAKMLTKLEKSIENLENEHRNLDNVLVLTEARFSSYRADLESCLEELADRNGCRNISCDADFTCFVEYSGSYISPNFTLRCAKCRCKYK